MTNDGLERAVERLIEYAAMWDRLDHNPQWGSDLRLILAANRKMRTALEPFVQTANQCPANWPDEARPGVINLGHCRKARSVLSTKETT